MSQNQLYSLARFVALLLVALAAWAVIAWHNGKVETVRAAGYDKAVGEYRDRELQAVKAARAEERRDIEAVRKEAEDARKEAQALHAALVDAERSGGRLRNALAAARRAGCPNPAAPAGGSPPAEQTEGMLADVYRRYDEATRRVERFADEAHIAGLACERVYDTVNK